MLKIFDENSIEKLDFNLFLGKLLLKIEPSEITSFFYNNFSGSGWGVEPANPLLTPLFVTKEKRLCASNLLVKLEFYR